MYRGTCFRTRLSEQEDQDGGDGGQRGHVARRRGVRVVGGKARKTKKRSETANRAEQRKHKLVDRKTLD